MGNSSVSEDGAKRQEYPTLMNKDIFEYSGELIY